MYAPRWLQDSVASVYERELRSTYYVESLDGERDGIECAYDSIFWVQSPSEASRRLMREESAGDCMPAPSRYRSEARVLAGDVRSAAAHLYEMEPYEDAHLWCDEGVRPRTGCMELTDVYVPSRGDVPTLEIWLQAQAAAPRTPEALTLTYAIAKPFVINEAYFGPASSTYRVEAALIMEGEVEVAWQPTTLHVWRGWEMAMYAFLAAGGAHPRSARRDGDGGREADGEQERHASSPRAVAADAHRRPVQA